MKPTIYKPFPAFPLQNRQWPDNTITTSPTWCSVDLSEGVQALPYPMSEEKKWQLFHLLKTIGVKQIELGMPGLCESDFLFVRKLINARTPLTDTTIQVMAKMKEKQIYTCFEAIKGASEVVMHLFHSTSCLRRDDIFEQKTESALIQHAVNSMLFAKEKSKVCPDTKIHFQYSPEGFNTTDPMRLIKLCQAVIEVLKPTEDAPVIINFFEAVEADKPNQFADRIEYLIREIEAPAHVSYSIRAHNDRGTGVAASEMALLAGVTRVEGSLLGAGARAGTTSLVTLALNLYTQGIMPGLDLSDVSEIVSTFEETTGETVGKCQPYVGETAFTAFSSHEQFAIDKALESFDADNATRWDVPYLPMNPIDIGRDNDGVIRLNHRSGRTGITHVMKKYHGYCLPISMQKEFASIVKAYASQNSLELEVDNINTLFHNTYIKQTSPITLRAICFEKAKDNPSILYCKGKLLLNGESIEIYGEGNGALHTVLNALKTTLSLEMEIDDYCQHALGHTAMSKAASYVKLFVNNKRMIWGVGVDDDATLANIRALISAVNRTMDVKND